MCERIITQVHAETLHNQKLWYWHLDAFFGKLEHTYNLYLLSKLFLYFPIPFSIILNRGSHQKLQKAMEVIYASWHSISNSSVEADTWNKTSDETFFSLPSLTPCLGEEYGTFLMQRPATRVPLTHPPQGWNNSSVQVLHQIGMSFPGQCPKTEQEELLVGRGSGLPWEPLARAEFTCYVCSDN